MATQNYVLIDRKSCRLALSRQKQPLLKRPRLSIAPSHQARGAVGNRFGGADSRTALGAPKARATRHKVPFLNLVIRTLTKNYLFN